MRTRAAVKRVVKDILLVVYTKSACTGVEFGDRLGADERKRKELGKDGIRGVYIC